MALTGVISAIFVFCGVLFGHLVESVMSVQVVPDSSRTVASVVRALLGAADADSELVVDIFEEQILRLALLVLEVRQMFSDRVSAVLVVDGYVYAVQYLVRVLDVIDTQRDELTVSAEELDRDLVRDLVAFCRESEGSEECEDECEFFHCDSPCC